MSREKELVKNTIILSLGRFLPQLTSFVTLPILTSCLTKVEYGTYDLVATLIMLVIPIATLQIQSAAFRFLIESRNDYYESASVITNIFVVIIPISFIVSIAVQFFFSEFSSLERLFIAVYLFTDTVQLTVGQIIRGLGNNKDYSIAACILSVVNMVGIVLGLFLLKKGLLAVLISLSLAQISALAYMGIRTKLVQYLSLNYASAKKITELLAYSWPMIPNNLSSWVLKLSDRLVITAFLGIEANAVYAVANKIPNLLSMAQSILVMAWQENASIAASDKDVSAYYAKMLDTTFDLMTGCTAILIAATPIIFSVLIRGEYSEAYYQMPVLILAMFFFVLSSFLGGIYIAHKRTVNVGITTMVAAGINFIVDISLVQKIGIWAGSLSTLAAYVFLYYYRMINCQKFQKVEVKFAKQFVEIAILIGMTFLCFKRQLEFDCANGFLGILLFAFLNKNVLEKVAKKAVRKG